ncbi:UDP-N-acetylmuramate dehydrogenase [Sulfurovum sp. bin170]|uniref:UDP-N-acetylmuramate dehydrogenase n=1 Tax=Sulfurovum sp. bin170 TaxID=2695268 RepID=UPI0013DF45E8|nr:UDP-N-acetylmuramate dehydrogenase [Sulfurovum sp. bin170]NEW61752.1 UDP-N-acetylmuramate dehydrogenase [Sulfurovum sp. bin170]
MFFKTIDFSKFSSIRVGQPTEVLMLERGDKIPNDRVIIGHANNLLLSPTPPPLMMLSKDFSFIELDDGLLTIGCATPTGKIVSFAKKHNITGFEFISKLPGSLGGMIAMNAGVKSYEIFNIIDSIKIDGVWIPKDNIEHGYRFAELGGVATEVRFRVEKGFDKSLLEELKDLRSNQPKTPSAGSAFKNPKGDYAGRLIEAVRLKGVSQGAMQWSEIHSNFLVNNGGGVFEDAKYLIDLAKGRVFEEFEIELEEEVQIL